MLYIDSDFTEFCSQGSDFYLNIGSDTGFALIRRQAIIWSANYGLVYWPISGSDSNHVQMYS